MRQYLGILSFIGLLAITSFAGDEKKEETLVINKPEFSASSLIAPEYRGTNSLSLLDPNKFNMSQSYSMSFSAGGFGSQSSGLYLNTISYQLAAPLSLEVDWGIWTPFHSSVNMSGLNEKYALGQDAPTGSFVLPRIGLEYRPTENSLISINYFNANDAWKAYGHSHRFGNPWD